MFDIAPSELMLVALVALVVIGPKDLPKAMRFVGIWVGRARGVMGQFRAGFDNMMREAELKELEAKWAAENERIMREFPNPNAPAMLTDAGTADAGADGHAAAPAMVEKPALNGTVLPPSDDEIAAAEGIPQDFPTRPGAA